MKAINVGTKVLGAVLVVMGLLAFSTPARAEVTANPQVVDFGTVAVGTRSASVSVTLTNSNSRRSVNFSGVSISSSRFSYSGPTGSFSLRPNQSLKVSVSFSPDAAQSFTGSLTFKRSYGNPITVSLSGTGQGAGTPPVVVAPSITSQPVSRTVTAGQAASFSVTATGSALAYQWTKNGAAISGATSSTFTMTAATSDNGTQFAVMVSNSAGSATSNAATLTINSGGACLQNSGSTWTNSPFPTQSTVLTASFDATPSQANMDGVIGFSLNAATGYTSLAAIVRFADTGMIDARDGSVYSASVAVPYVAGSSYHFRLVINPSTKRYDAYVSLPGQSEVAVAINYAFRVEQAATSTLNNWGALTTGAAMTICNVAISESAGVPAITAQPASRTIIAGQTAAFSITAGGSATLTYQWMKNGAAITGATSSNYTTAAATMPDSGAQFTCTVSNSAGNVTSNAATLTVNAAAVAPSITTQPASRTIIAGQTAAFSVSVSGTAPLAYQWMKNGAAISGAVSSSYTTPAAATSDNGAQFTVVVSNSAGNVTSNAATLTVNAATLLLSTNPGSLSFGNINVGGSASQQATLTNSGNGNVTLSGMSFAGTGFSASGVSSGQILTPGQAATVTVTFRPAAAGSMTGSVTVASNASASAVVTLSGSGVQPVAHTASLSWLRSTSTVSGYQVYSAQVAGGPYRKLTTSALSLPNYSDSSVQNGQTYYYVVTAVDAAGTESAYSNQASAVIQ